MFRPLLALIQKEFLQTLRDRRMLVIIFLIPLIQTTIFGVAVSNEVRNVPIAVIDSSRTLQSRELIDALRANDHFRFVYLGPDVSRGEELLRNNAARIAVYFPPDYARRLDRGEVATVQALVDGSDSNSAGIALGYMQRIVAVQSAATLRPRSLSPIALSSRGGVELRDRLWYNPGGESRYYLLPGIGTMVLTTVIMLLTAMGITRERETGSFDQLVVSPIRPWQLLLGKTAPFAVIGLLEAALVTAASVFLFGQPFVGSLATLSALDALYVVVMLGLGLLISSVSASQQQAMLTVFAFLLPATILSDFFFPLANMPEPIRWLTIVNPMRYCMAAQRMIFLKGAGFAEIKWNLVALAGLAFLFYGLGALRFKRMLR
ncbi:MAG: ABC transporter permease [Leptospirales bacterium]|nr:ABC transporter permease [Leptospirales bacterium]